MSVGINSQGLAGLFGIRIPGSEAPNDEGLLLITEYQTQLDYY